MRTRRRWIRILALAAGLAVSVTGFALAKSYQPTVVRTGDLIVTLNGGITPSELPRNEFVPIKAETQGTVTTASGGHPPSAKSFVVSIDKSFAIEAKGLPVCSVARITATSTADAKRACRGAIVGSGSAEAEVAFPEQKPFSARGPLVFFNGGTRGGTTLLLVHLYASIPAPTAIVTSVAITKVNKGRYGLEAKAQVPVIAGGSGSITKFEFTVDRKFAYRGERRSYLMARCPTGTYLTKIQASFRDGSSLDGTVVRACAPAGG